MTDLALDPESTGEIHVSAGDTTVIRHQRDLTEKIQMPGIPLFAGEALILDARPHGGRWQETLADFDPRHYPPVPPPPPPPAPDGTLSDGDGRPLPPGTPPPNPIPPAGPPPPAWARHESLELPLVRRSAPYQLPPDHVWSGPKHRAPARFRWLIAVGALLAFAGLAPFIAWWVMFR